MSNLALKSKNAIVNNNLIQPNLSKLSSDANICYQNANIFIEGVKDKYVMNVDSFSYNNILQFKDVNSVADVISNNNIDSVWLFPEYADYAVIGSSVVPLARQNYTSNDSAPSTILTNFLNSVTPRPSNEVITAASNVASYAVTSASKNDTIVNIASIISTAVANSLNESTPKIDPKIIVHASTAAAVAYATSASSVNSIYSASRNAYVVLNAVTNALNITMPNLDNKLISIASSTAAASYSATNNQIVIGYVNNFFNVYKNILYSITKSSTLLNLFHQLLLSTSLAKNYIDFMVDNYKCNLIDKNIQDIFNAASNMYYNANNLYNNTTKWINISGSYITDVSSLDYFNLRITTQNIINSDIENTKSIISKYLLSDSLRITNSIAFASNDGLTHVNAVSNLLSKFNSVTNKTDVNISYTDYLQQLLLVAYMYLTISDNNNPSLLQLNLM
jgi:hypothetical protein